MAAPRAAHRFAGVYDPSSAVIKACWERRKCLKDVVEKEMEEDWKGRSCRGVRSEGEVIR